MIVQVLLLAGVATAAPTGESLEIIDPNPSYSVSWDLKNEPTYLDSSRSETLRDGIVEGQYSYLRPDGKMQVVSYTASKDTGFVANMEVRDVMAPFGDAGHPGFANGGGHSGRSFTSAGSSFGPFSSSSSSLDFLSTGKSLNGGSSSHASSSSSSHQSNFNRGTSRHTVTNSVTPLPVVHNIHSTTSGDFVQQSPQVQTAFFTPSPVIHQVRGDGRSSFSSNNGHTGSFSSNNGHTGSFSSNNGHTGSFSSNNAQTGFIPVTSTPAFHTTSSVVSHSPVPVPSQSFSANRGRSFFDSSSQFNSQSQGSGVAHVKFNSPTHQYSYPLSATF